MDYELSNGVRIQLYGNTHTAKFLLFAYPRLGVSFVGPVPRMTVTPDVCKLIAVRDKLIKNAEFKAKIESAKRDLIENWGFDEFDDEIPF